MAAILITTIQEWVGTAAERAGITPTKAGSFFVESDTGFAWRWDGSAWFKLIYPES